MLSNQKITASRRTYNKLVGNEMMEDFALRFTAKRARKWSYSRIAHTALGIVSFLVLEAIGGAITLNYGFVNAAWAILALVVVIFIIGLPISYYAARYGVDIDLLSRGAGFGYIGSTIASLIYASFTFIFFALEAAIMTMALKLLFGIPLYIGYLISALVVLPLVTHGITYISRFQMWTQPIWIVLQVLPLVYVFNHADSQFSEWISFTGQAGESGSHFNLLLFGAASAVLLSLVAQIGEQVDILRFLPAKSSTSSNAKWWVAMVAGGPGWIVFGAAKLFIGSYLAYFALQKGVPLELADDPAHMYQIAFGYVFENQGLSLAVAAMFVILCQLKINVANAYAGSLAWSNFFSRVTHNHPGRVVWMVFNVLIALLLMELGIYQTIESMLQVYSVLVLAWLSSVVADLIINKPLGISPKHIEFKRANLYDINPVGTLSMLIASVAGFTAHMGWFGITLQALGSYLAFFLPFITVPILGIITKGQYYLVRPEQEATTETTCHICENSFDQEDMSYCPAYGKAICSLCCSLDVRCGDICREHATLAAQSQHFFSRFIKENILITMTSTLAQCIALTLILSGISATILVLIYWQLPITEPELNNIFATTLLKIFFFLLIIIGMVSWLFILARSSNRSALTELRSQTKALAEEVFAHEKTAIAYQLAKETAESANQAKSRYLSGLSHELRTPLHVLLGYAQLLSQDQRLSRATHDSVIIMKRNGEHLADLIEGILEVSKIEAGRLFVHRDEVSLRPILEQLVSMFKQQAETKGLEFHFQCPHYLPEYVITDKQRFRQILINLIANAVKFTESGSVTLQVSYKNEVGHFVVQDTGPGISKSNHELIFKPFERVSNLNNASVPGTGLGLTISRALADLMGGDIDLASEVGKGSTFKLSLMMPRIQSPHQPEIFAEKRIESYLGDRKSILVIDDDHSQRKLVDDILSPLEFTILGAASAEDGLSVLANNKVDLIFLDLKMPKIDGWQAARLIRKANYAIPIIIISANVRDLDVANHADGFHDDYLVKPFDIKVLLRKIAHQLNLTWCYEEEQIAGTVVTDAIDTSSIKPVQLQSLRSLAEIGYLSGFINKLNLLEKEASINTDLNEELRQLAGKCQFNKIITRLDELLQQSNTSP